MVGSCVRPLVKQRFGLEELFTEEELTVSPWKSDMPSTYLRQHAYPARLPLQPVLVSNRSQCPRLQMLS